MRPTAATGARTYPSVVTGNTFQLPEVIRLLLVEDDQLLRASLTSALEGEWSRIIGSVGSATEAVAIAERERFDVLLTDLDLGREVPTGAVLAHALRSRHPGIGVVVLTSYVDPRLMGTKLSQLPSGTEYVTKQSVRDLDVLRTAVVRAAVRGAQPLPAAIDQSSLHLTDTQVETMRLIAEGLSNAEIATQRFVTKKSVEVTVSRIIKQLGIEPDRSRNARVEIARTYFALAGAHAATAGTRTA